MSDLKPCLCGSDKVHFGYEPFCGLTFWRVMCDTCGTETSTFDTKEEAAKVWNTRPAEDAKDREIERLKAALDSCRYFANNSINCFQRYRQNDLLEKFYDIRTTAEIALKDTPDTGKMEENK